MSSYTYPSSQYANSVAYIDGSVYTVNDLEPWADGFIVSEEGVFLHVGSTTEIWTIAKEFNIVTIHLNDQFVMPGIHDAHMSVGPDAAHRGIVSKISEGICACEYQNVYQDWLLAAAYSNEDFPNGIADRKYLDIDGLFGDRPVAVQGSAAHSMLLNTEALRRAGYDIENEPDTHGAKFFRRPDGSLTGELAEAAMTKAALAIPKPNLAHVRRTLKHAIRLAHKAGVTSMQEASANTQLLHALSEMEMLGSLNLDINAHIVYDCEWLASEPKDSLDQLLDAAEQYYSKHVDTRFVKIMLDGVPLPPLFTHAGIDEHGHVDQSKIATQDVVDAVLKFDQLGRTVKIHCTGHGSTRLALDAIEAARKVNPHGPRHEIAHNSGVHEDDYHRYRRLNATAEMSPAELFVHPVTASSNGLMNWDFPRMLASGALMTIGSDWGAVPDPSLLGAMAKIVETVGNGDKIEGGELLCRMLTLNGAMAVGKDHILGSIEVGKTANFIVVDRDLSRGEFEGARVVRTYFEGEKVWDANA